MRLERMREMHLNHDGAEAQDHEMQDVLDYEEVKG